MRPPFWNDFATAVKPHFEFLSQEHGYALVYEQTAGLIYESPKLRIRVTREREQTSFDVRARGDYRDYDAEIVALLLNGATEYSRSAAPPDFTPAGSAAFLRARLTEIEELFTPTRAAETMRRGEQLKNDRGERLFGAGRQRS
jgi:hypothetical protein